MQDNVAYERHSSLMSSESRDSSSQGDVYARVLKGGRDKDVYAVVAKKGDHGQAKGDNDGQHQDVYAVVAKKGDLQMKDGGSLPQTDQPSTGEYKILPACPPGYLPTCLPSYPSSWLAVCCLST